MSILHGKIMEEDIRGKPMKELYHPEFSICPYFEITPEFYAAAGLLYTCNALTIGLFRKVCKDTVNKMTKRRAIDLRINHLQIFEVIIKPVLENLRDTVKNLVFGEIKFQRVIKFFDERHLHDLVEQMERINDLLSENYKKKDLRSCAEKVKCLFQLRKSVDTSEKFLLVKEKLQLSGDFSKIAKIKDQVTQTVLIENN